MSKPKILIIGGGIGGLSCATALAETGKFDISIYESDILGGQASTQKSKLCNTETCWRAFGTHYNNLSSIMEKLNIGDNFYSVVEGDVCMNNKQHSVAAEWDNTYKLINNLANNNDISQLSKILNVLFMCKDRAINEYHDIYTYDYYKNKFIDKIIGPIYGLEPKKTTLSALYKFNFSVFDTQTRNNTKIHGLTKYPTSDVLFNPWKKFLEDKKVKIYENYKLDDIITDKNGRIVSVSINNKRYTGDEIVFACSIHPLITIFNNNIQLKNTLINKRINILGTGQQLYISVNFYWKQNIIKDRECHTYVFMNGWMPFIIKRFINTDYVSDNCNPNIKEVWNIAPANFLKGNYVKKFVNQCSFEEIVYELKMNIMNSEHFKNYFDFENNTWDDYFYDYEFDDRYYKKLPSTEKFSINKNIEKNLLNNKEPELGDNVYFSAYYVKNTVGGASMETSCEIGLTTADLICKKYHVENPRKPVYKTQWYLYAFMIPFVLLDCVLYKLNLNPITDYVNSILLLVIYLIFVICIIIYMAVYLMKFTNIKKKQIIYTQDETRI